jgi:hypothetical protein
MQVIGMPERRAYVHLHARGEEEVPLVLLDAIPLSGTLGLASITRSKPTPRCTAPADLPPAEDGCTPEASRNREEPSKTKEVPMTVRRVLRIAVAFVIGSMGFVGNMQPAVAHGTCSPYLDVRIYAEPGGASAYGGEFSLFCNERHYSYQGRARLQSFRNGNWSNIEDSGVRYDCCNLYNPRPDTPAFGWSTGIGNICPPSGTITLRTFINYIQIINANGNVGHRYTTLASAPESFSC